MPGWALGPVGTSFGFPGLAYQEAARASISGPARNSVAVARVEPRVGGGLGVAGWEE